LTRRLRLHQELYLLGHDEDGRPLTHLAALRLGLAGAVLLDLTVTGRLHVAAGTLSVYDPTPLADGVADTVVAALLADRRRQDRQLRVWLKRLAQDADERTRGGLVAAGVLTRATRRRLRVLAHTRYQPTGYAPTVIARARPRYAVHGQQTPDAQCAALCGLLAVLRLHDTLYLDLPGGDVLDRLHRIADRQSPPAREITTTVEALIGELAIAVYR
jgi:Golgi phosphoprotein 3 (GPP34)